MPVIYKLKLYRAIFGDTLYDDIPMVDNTLEEAKLEACEVLKAHFLDNRKVGTGRRAPTMVALLDDSDHVIARFEYTPGVRRPEGAYEVPIESWHHKMEGTPTPEIARFLEDRLQ